MNKQLKKALMSISFDWVEAPKYSRNGSVVYQDDSLFFSPNRDSMWQLVQKGPILCLVHGDVSHSLLMFSEYNVSDEYIIKTAKVIDEIARKKII